MKDVINIIAAGVCAATSLYLVTIEQWLPAVFILLLAAGNVYIVGKDR